MTKHLGVELLLDTLTVIFNRKITLENLPEHSLNGIVTPELFNSMCIGLYKGGDTAVNVALDFYRQFGPVDKDIIVSDMSSLTRLCSRIAKVFEAADAIPSCKHVEVLPVEWYIEILDACKTNMYTTDFYKLNWIAWLKSKGIEKLSEEDYYARAEAFEEFRQKGYEI